MKQTRVNHARRYTAAALWVAGVALPSACTPRQSVQTRTAEGVVDIDTTTANRASTAGQPPTASAPMQAVLDELAALGGKAIETLTPAEARQQPTPADAAKAVMTKQGMPAAPDAAVTTVDRTIPGPAGPLPVRIYTPAGATGPLPVIVYYHGGGFVIANKQVYDGGARGLSRAANAVVVSVDYRQAPENKFPAAHEDALATYRWALENAASINGNPDVVALAGESAGGNLALATAIAARDAGVKRPAHVLAVYPIAGTDTTTPSYVQNANAKPLNRAMMGWFVKHTIRSEADLRDPRLNLLDANLQGLPPVTIVAAEIDPLRSEGEMLAEKLRSAGVDVDRRQWDGVAHEFFGMAQVVPAAMEAQEYAATRMTKNLRP